MRTPWLLPRRPRKPRKRRGYVLVLFAIMIIMLLALAGLLIDGGFLLGSSRQARNVADAAAKAAAMQLYRGKAFEDIEATAIAYVRDHNGLADAEVEVNIPPLNGPYSSGSDIDNYVEVIVRNDVNTFLIHVLPGIEQSHSITGRAVAGLEALSIDEGAIVLDPRARPGLTVDGGATLEVDGSVIDNSRASGYDHYDEWMDTGYQQYAGEVSNNSTLRARYIQFVGGVNDLDNIENYVAGGPNPLFAGARIAPDPLADLPIPDGSNGADLTERGAVSFDNNDPKPSYLDPGIYNDIQINNGAEIIFNPGIYILSPSKPNAGLRINGDVTVTASGVMFYATGSNYLDNGAGYYDTLDGAVELDYSTDELPPPPDPDFNSLRWATIDINANNANITFTGLADPSSPFDGVMFFQRRRNESQVQLQANAGANVLFGGTIYGKWARFKLAGDSRYDAQFVVGSMQVTGQATVTIHGDGNNQGTAFQVFLVE